MLPWNQRPVEVANLFNPAFCALLLTKAVASYQKTASRGMDYSMAFVLLPVVLHKATRDAFPHSTSTKLQVWMQKHHHVRIGFAERMQNMVKITREALLFGLQHGVLALDETGALVIGNVKLGAYTVPKYSEATECAKGADFVGRWFADAGSIATFFTAWGIKIQ
jgi:hypothetical protein